MTTEYQLDALYLLDESALAFEVEGEIQALTLLSSSELEELHITEIETYPCLKISLGDNCIPGTVNFVLQVLLKTLHKSLTDAGFNEIDEMTIVTEESSYTIQGLEKYEHLRMKGLTLPDFLKTLNYDTLEELFKDYTGNEPKYQWIRDNEPESKRQVIPVRAFGKIFYKESFTAVDLSNLEYFDTLTLMFKKFLKETNDNLNTLN